MCASYLYKHIVSSFPQTHMRLAFAYGSGVFRQSGHKDMCQNMIDFIFAVDDPVAWHRENIQINPQHYSFLKYFGPNYIGRFQENTGAGIYFNTLVPCRDRVIKYGVISTENLVNDLFDWETLYVSGRLHKPVFIIDKKDGRSVEVALQSNLQSAMHAALLLLPDQFTESELYFTITGLSYTGDFRMTVGEDKNKIENIVRPNMEHFRQLYESVLDNDDHVNFNKSYGTLEQSITPASKFHHLSLLPKYIQNGLVLKQNSDGKNRDTEEVLRLMSHDSDCPVYISNCISGIVKASSWSQSAKGLCTAGVSKSWRYSYAKIQKMMASNSKALIKA